MTDRRLIQCEIEHWQRYGAYLTGVTDIARRFPELDFDRFYRILCSYQNHGCWSKQALQNAWRRT